MPSIVDPGVRRGGAWTVTRGLVALFRGHPWRAEVVPLVPPEPRWRRAWQLACLAAAPFGGLPAKARFVRTRGTRGDVRRAFAREHFDLVVINGSDMLWCLDETPPGTPTLAIVHNREADLFAEQVATTLPRTGPVQRLLRPESERLRRFEIGGLSRAQAAIFLSEADAAVFAARLPDLPQLVLPPLFEGVAQRVPKAPVAGLDLGLLANFDWWPNRDGVDWFVREVLDRVGADVRLHLFGRRSESAAAAHPRVVAHGFVDDLRDVWRRCDWMVIPTRHGAGVSVKTAESLYHGMPIISTRFGLRGLPAIRHPQVVVRDDAQGWVDFLTSPQSRALCTERLPPEVGRLFALDAHRARFDRFLARVLDRDAAASADD